MGAATCADTCTPDRRESAGVDQESPFFRADRLRHPCVGSLAAGNAFVPNDVRLGGAADRRTGEGAEGVEPNTSKSRSPPLTLLTGPNMGGKSTLLRQVCLAAVMAHVGTADRSPTSLARDVRLRRRVRAHGRARRRRRRALHLHGGAGGDREHAPAVHEGLLGGAGRALRGTSTSDGFAIASAVVGGARGSGRRTTSRRTTTGSPRSTSARDDEARLAAPGAPRRRRRRRDDEDATEDDAR